MTKSHFRKRVTASALPGLLMAGMLASPPSHAAITLLDKDQWKVSFGGFAELDVISDSVRSFTEVVGNAPVDRPDYTNLNGQLGRTQFSVRNTRFAFSVEAPEADGWKSKGYIESDFLGFDPGPTNTTASINTEAAFFNNPTLRVRHAYLNAETNGWQFLAGQTWNFFGWQPYFFMPTVQISPVAGMVFGRTPQVRAVKSFELNPDMIFQAGLSVMRPPQRDSGIPGFEGGLRFILGSRSAGFAGATGPEKTQPLSVGISGLFREFRIPDAPGAPTSATSYHPASALAVDALIPILASPDNKDVGNTLSLGGEYTTGSGYGDQFVNWTSNQANPIGSTGNTPDKNLNLDAGIGGFDGSQTFNLTKLQTLNGYLQYHLPSSTRTWLSAGYGKLYSSNATTFTDYASGKIAYDKSQVMYANVFHDFTSQVRVGLEYAHNITEYADGLLAHANRYQFSAWFLF